MSPTILTLVEVEVTIDKQGRLSDPDFVKGSGDDKWDQSVRNVFAIINQIDRPPPTNFPSRVTIRFDVQEETGTGIAMSLKKTSRSHHSFAQRTEHHAIAGLVFVLLVIFIITTPHDAR